jgi:hypothetical protein
MSVLHLLNQLSFNFQFPVQLEPLSHLSLDSISAESLLYLLDLQILLSA